MSEEDTISIITDETEKDEPFGWLNVVYLLGIAVVLVTVGVLFGMANKNVLPSEVYQKGYAIGYEVSNTKASLQHLRDIEQIHKLEGELRKAEWSAEHWEQTATDGLSMIKGLSEETAKMVDERLRSTE